MKLSFSRGEIDGRLFDNILLQTFVLNHKSITYLEQLHEVVELAVDVATYRDGTSHFLHIRLLG